MNSWVGLWVGHTLPEAAAWVFWPLWAALLSCPSYSTSNTAKNCPGPSSFEQKTLRSLAYFKPVEDSSRILDLSSNFNNWKNILDSCSHFQHCLCNIPIYHAYVDFCFFIVPQIEQYFKCNSWRWLLYVYIEILCFRREYWRHCIIHIPHHYPNLSEFGARGMVLFSNSLDGHVDSLSKS